ncbi:MAG: hypothetical protein V3T83_17915, partial [Acidobacteriota bacterium]
RDGVKAVQKGLQDDAPPDDAIWQQAIEDLQQAIQADPRPSRSKRVEGTFREPYFPYLYLGIACLRAGKLDQAQHNFKESSGRGEALKDGKFAAQELALYEGRLSVKLAEATPAAESGPSEEMKAFEAQVTEAETNLGQSRWEQAISSFDQAENLNSDEFQSRGLSSGRNEARQGWAREKASSAQRLLDSGSLNQARTLYEEAARIWPDLDEASQGLSAIRNREQQYQRTKSQAEQSFRSQDYPRARQLYLQAQRSHPEMAAADNLNAVLTDLDARLSAASSLRDCFQAFDQGDYQLAKTLCAQLSGSEGQRYVNRAEARLTFQQGQQAASRGDYSRAEELFQQSVDLDGNDSEASQALKKSRGYNQALNDAQGRFQDWGGNSQQLTPLNSADDSLGRAEGVDANRFGSDPQAQRLRRDIDQALDQESQAETSDPVNQAVRKAALDLFQGRIGKAQQALESILQTSPPNPHLHFFLGVAYATSALEGPGGQGFRQLRSQALAQFRLALKEDSDYPLPKRLVSPLILGLFEEAKQ